MYLHFSCLFALLPPLCESCFPQPQSCESGEDLLPLLSVKAPVSVPDAKIVDLQPSYRRLPPCRLFSLSSSPIFPGFRSSLLRYDVFFQAYINTFIIIHYHSLSFIIIHYHSLSFIIIRCHSVHSTYQYMIFVEFN